MKPYLCINNLVYDLGVQSMPSLPIILTEPFGSERNPYGFKNRVQNLLWNWCPQNFCSGLHCLH